MSTLITFHSIPTIVNAWSKVCVSKQPTFRQWWVLEMLPQLKKVDVKKF